MKVFFSECWDRSVFVYMMKADGQSTGDLSVAKGNLTLWTLSSPHPHPLYERQR